VTRYVPHTERHGSDAWAGFEAALGRYLDAEIAVLEAAVKMARTASVLNVGDGE
jgi:hypothetical protein